ncbi:MAG: conjugal transfer protein TraO [Paludibacteraceae bacterium]|nr:conjugal transfer protein TraO [Paludibacteraceae bacterium]MBR6111931.1 conjugal transfer protein TraO [Paludibacteraceae bacterium]
MKKIYMIFLALFCAIGCCNAQLIHTKGQMGLGFRWGKAYKNDYNIGLFYNLYTSEKLGLLIELDREKAEFEFSKFTNQFLLGVGCEVAVWHPSPKFYINLDLAGNIGYDQWDCTVMDWQEKHIVGGANAGVGFELYPWHFLSFVLKAREFMIYGKGMNYLKPDYSLGVKVNW